MSASSMPIPKNVLSKSKSRLIPSPQQQDIFDWVDKGKGSAFIEAVAGSGKTTTLVLACERMLGSVAFTAFNKKIADEIKSRVNNFGNVRVGTFHSFGFASWRKVAPYCIVDEYAKSRRMIEYLSESSKDLPWGMRGAVTRLVSIAKQSMIGKLWQAYDEETWERLIRHFDIMFMIDGIGSDIDSSKQEQDVIDDLIYFAREGIAWSIERGEDIIDFDDMIWLPLLKDAPVYQYDWVLVDEAQDTNEARRLLAGRMLKDNGRAIFVGDRYQSIYGFSGADSDAVDRLIDDFKCVSLPLTVTYRCSQNVTRLAREYVPHIVAHEDNEEGRVIKQTASIYFTQPHMSDTPELSPQPGDAILCRNTKPLVTLAFQLLRREVPCHVEGRDIGKSLDRLAAKWKVDNVTELLQKLETYRQRETDRIVSTGALYNLEPLNDRIDTLIVITEDCETVGEVRLKIDRMFKDSDTGEKCKTVTLSTVHKAKGREWDRVFILGWGEYMPSRWARQAWEKSQERNLIYVAVTRAKTELVLTSSIDHP